MKKRKSITICTSASFFKEALRVEEELNALGFAVKLPYTASVMKKTGDFKVSTYKTWFKDASTYSRKSWLIKNHLRKVIAGDAVLLLNYEKNGMPGYIGGNTLIEAAIGFHYKKPLFILNPISDELSFKEEILGMQPVFLNGDVKKISF
ncbi:MAG: hypothetical protein WC052_02925 [Patescibacteria group bacterium]|jgi:hypothetical protein